MSPEQSGEGLRAARVKRPFVRSPIDMYIIGGVEGALSRGLSIVGEYKEEESVAFEKVQMGRVVGLMSGGGLLLSSALTSSY